MVNVQIVALTQRRELRVTTKDEKVKESAARTLEQDLQEIIFSGPAVFANRIFVTLTPFGVRITFVEQQENAQPAFRTATYLNILDAISFRDLLNRQLNALGTALGESVQAEEQ